MPPKRPPLTHFLCLPLVTAQSSSRWNAALQHINAEIVQQLASQETLAVPKNASTGQIPAKALRPLGTLHLTIGVMSLADTERIEAAAHLLQSLDLRRLLEAAEPDLPKNGEDSRKSPERSEPKDPLIIRQIAERGEDAKIGNEGYQLSKLSVEASNSAGSTSSRLRANDSQSAAIPLADKAKCEPDSTDPENLIPDSSRGSDSTTSDVPVPGPSAQPLTVSFIGLKSMHSPKSTSFLYTAPLDTTGRLYPFCQSLKDVFTKKGFMEDENRPLKLHATIVNTIYAGKVPAKAKLVKRDDGRFRIAKAESPTDSAAINETSHENVGEESGDPPSSKRKKGKGKKQVLKFDARELLKQYDSFVLARDVCIERLAICEMGAEKMTNEAGEVVEEKYQEVAAVPLPLGV